MRTTGALHVTLLERRDEQAPAVYRAVFAPWADPDALWLGECQGERELISFLTAIGLPPRVRHLPLMRLALNGHASIQAVSLTADQLGWFHRTSLREPAGNVIVAG